MNKVKLLIVLVLVLQSCASKKDIFYFQDADATLKQEVFYEASKIQPNDILSITVTASIPETAIPYNIQPGGSNNAMSIELLKLQGYLVSSNGSIVFPNLGKLKIAGVTPSEAEEQLQLLLEEGEHLIKPNVSVRILNAKVTVLGEVNFPGTFSFTEQNISLLQALGYASDLTINGERNDVLLIREENGIRITTHLDLTSINWFNSPYYYVKPNDIIVVNPNTSKVKSSGIIGNASNVLAILSLVLTSVVLITK